MKTTSANGMYEPYEARETNGTSGTSETFMSRLRARMDSARTLLCVGLDPEPGRFSAAALSALPDGASAEIEEMLVAYNAAIVEATAGYVCAFKPNSAFYEAHGEAGLRALRRTIALIHERHPDVPVLLDVKRGDIGSTSRAYAQAAFDIFGADAVTLQPYLGGEALAPFLARDDRGCFILCRTSNPGGGELQDLLVMASDGSQQPLYLAVAERVASEWNARGNCGLVVGATYPGELRRVRAVAPDLPILVPGIGAQGGDLEGTVRAGLDASGLGLLISASRSVYYASDGADFAAAAATEARRLRDAINAERGELAAHREERRA